MTPLRDLKSSFWIGAALCTSSCGSFTAPLTASTTSVACPTGVARIAIGDAYMEDLCGCTEGNGVQFAVGTSLTCTLPAGGSGVFFQFLGTSLEHQVLSTGSPAFVSSPVSDPNADDPIRIHFASLSTSGNYHFLDAFNAGLSGTISVP